MKISLEEINNVLKVIEPIYFKFKQESHAKKNYEEMEILKLKTKILKLKNKNLKLVNEKKVLKRRANFFGKEIRKKNGIVLEINEKYREHKNWKCSNNYSNLNKQINHPCDKYPDSINDESLLSEDDEYEEPQEEPRPDEEPHPDENVITEDDTDDAESLASLLEKEEENERLRVIEDSHDEHDDEDEGKDDEDDEDYEDDGEDDGEDENVHEDEKHEKHEKHEKDEKDEKDDEDDEDDEEELYEITINNVDYYTTDQLETNGPVYEILDDGDYGKIVGHLKNKKFTPI